MPLYPILKDFRADIVIFRFLASKSADFVPRTLWPRVGNPELCFIIVDSVFLLHLDKICVHSVTFLCNLIATIIDGVYNVDFLGTQPAKVPIYAYRALISYTNFDTTSAYFAICGTSTRPDHNMTYNRLIVNCFNYLTDRVCIFTLALQSPISYFTPFYILYRTFSWKIML